VYLPRTTTATGLIRPEHAWAVDFEDNCAAFPKGAHDDDVDAFTQLLVWLMEHSTAEPASAMRPPEPILPTRPKIPSVFPRRRPW
jgi:hypothetical protein